MNDAEAHFLQLQLSTLREVNWLLFLLAVDHGTTDLRQQVRAQNPDVAAYLATLQPITKELHSIAALLTPEATHLLADLWPVIDLIVITAPRNQWMLPLSVHVFDTAGLQRTSDVSTTEYSELQSRFISSHRVNRVWYATISSAAGGGDMDDGIKAMLSSTTTCVTDVIVTKTDILGLSSAATATKRKDVKHLIEEYQQPLKSLAGFFAGDCFYVNCDPKVLLEAPTAGHQHPDRSGLPRVVDHLKASHHAQQRAAKVALSDACVSRFKLIMAASAIKFEKTMHSEAMRDLPKRIRLFLDKYRESLRKDVEAVSDIHDMVIHAASDAVAQKSLRQKFTCGSLKSHDYRQLGAWLHSPTGVAVNLNWAEYVLTHYFFSLKALTVLPDEFLKKLFAQLDSMAVKFLASVRDINTQVQKDFESHPLLTQMTQAVKEAEAIVKLSMDVWIADHKEIITDKAQGLSQTAGAVLSAGLTDAFSSFRDRWRPRRLPIRGSGIKKRIRDHIHAFMTKEANVAAFLELIGAQVREYMNVSMSTWRNDVS